MLIDNVGGYLPFKTYKSYKQDDHSKDEAEPGNNTNRYTWSTEQWDIGHYQLMMQADLYIMSTILYHALYII